MNEMMFFFGEYEHALDPQCRVSLPSDWRRDDGENRLILIPGGARDLLLLPFAMFQDLLVKAHKAALGSVEQRIALERLGAKMRRLEPDKQGRIRLEREMLDAIGVKNQLKLVGGITHIKLCAPENWLADDTGDARYLEELQKLNDRPDDIGTLLKDILPGKD